MKITTLMAAAAVGAGLAFVAPSAEAMPRGLAPVDVSETGTVQQVHGRHCKRIRGHRSRCNRVIRRTHRHKHCHHSGCHTHSHASNHHHSNSYWRKRRPSFSIQLNF
jgi:ABC-type Zn2+ transport system substrate-binding protein/surface adhesin